MTPITTNQHSNWRSSCRAGRLNDARESTMNQGALVTGEIAEWPTKVRMVQILKSGGLRARVGD